MSTYFPYPGKVWLNGHEWAKRQLDHAGIGYTPLTNGFAACDDADALQAVCDRFGPVDVQAFVDRWLGAARRWDEPVLDNGLPGASSPDSPRPP